MMVAFGTEYRLVRFDDLGVYSIMRKGQPYREWDTPCGFVSQGICGMVSLGENPWSGIAID
jgi:hypothetical protein